MPMSAQPAKPLLLILAELRNLAARGATGVFNIATDDGRFASIRVRGGEIESVTYRAKHNDAAIRLLAEAHSGRASFVAMPLRAPPAGLQITPISAPLRDWLLGKSDLDLAALNRAAQTAASRSPATAVNGRQTTAPRPPAGAPHPLVPDDGRAAPTRRRVIEQVAARYLGPIATLVCEDVLADCSNVEEALDRLASHLVSLDEVQQFLNDAHIALRTVDEHSA
jgi:hypothetical protein